MLARALRILFRGPAQTFARQMLRFDSAVGAHSLPEGARVTQREYVREVRIFGADLVPAGPILALSNHPGMTDTLSLFIALNRLDLKIIALQRPFLESIPHVAERLFFLTDDSAQRVSLVRKVSGHLRAGGAALTFPAGRIEPDPDLYPGALESLNDWTDSVGVFVRLAPETAVVPVLVRNVIWKATAHHPLLVIKKTREDKEKLAAALQLLAMVMFKIKPVSVTVQFGKPITVKELGTTDTQTIHRAVLAEMKCLIENPPRDKGINVL